jgi:hypothetical protein
MMDIYMIETDRLLVGRPKGILNNELASRIVELVEIKEVQSETGFHRFCDLDRLDGINISLADIEQLAVRRRGFNPNMIQVKSAFRASNPMAQAIAHLYEILLQSPRIEVRVFPTLEEAAAWLQTHADKLQL